MPRIDYVRFTVQKAGSDNVENFRSEQGTTLQELLEDDLCVNPSKFAVIVNGEEVSDLDTEIETGDRIKLQPHKLSSGRLA